MTSQPHSRQAENLNLPLTLADLISLIEADPNLTAQRRRDLVSALRRASSALQQSPRDIVVEPEAIMRGLTAVHPASLGINAASWANVNSLVRKALSYVPAMSRPPAAALLPEWAELWARVRPKHLAFRLSAICRHLSALGVEPPLVTAMHLESFSKSDWLRLRPNPAQSLRLTAGAWNQARRLLPAWPDIEWNIQQTSRKYVLGWEAFPPSLRMDAEAWLRRMGETDIFGDGPRRAAAASTIESRRWQIRAFATALVVSGIPASSVQSLDDLALHHRAGLEFFLDKLGEGNSVCGFARMVSPIVRHWVLPRLDRESRPNAEAVRIAATGALQACRRLGGRQTHGLRPRNLERMQPFLSETVQRRLVRLPQVWRAAADRLRDEQPYKAAVIAQYAVMLELLVMAPVRLDNLRNLQPAKHFIRPAFRGGDWVLRIDADEVKNDVRLEFPLPTATKELIDWYSAKHRPALASEPSDFLFPGRFGGRKDLKTLRDGFKKRVRDSLGVVVNPHLMRHLSGLFFLLMEPTGHSVIMRVLGHKSLDTTLRHYAGLEGRRAVQQYHQRVLELRAGDVHEDD